MRPSPGLGGVNLAILIDNYPDGGDRRFFHGNNLGIEEKAGWKSFLLHSKERLEQGGRSAT